MNDCLTLWSLSSRKRGLWVERFPLFKGKQLQDFSGNQEALENFCIFFFQEKQASRPAAGHRRNTIEAAVLKPRCCESLGHLTKCRQRDRDKSRNRQRQRQGAGKAQNRAPLVSTNMLRKFQEIDFEWLLPGVSKERAKSHLH